MPWLDILSSGLKDSILIRKENQSKAKTILSAYLKKDDTKSKEKVLAILAEATASTYSGISNDEILNETGISKRTCFI